MSRWYFTFGLGYNLGRNYVAVDADSAAEARRIFEDARRTVDDSRPLRWAFQYGEDEYETAVARWGLTEVPADTPIWGRA